MECLFCLARRATVNPIHVTRHILAQQTRAESTLRRTKTALRIPPHQSFTVSPETPQTDHIIFNPPSSAPNEYHTPLKFLPASDPRRKLYQLTKRLSPSSMAPIGSSGGANSQPQTQTQTQTQTHLQSKSNSQPKLRPRLPPAVRTPYTKKYHLTPTDVAEIQRLRALDPHRWTVARLAEKFDCSRFFVGLCSRASDEGIRRREDEVETARGRWGREKREAREDRVTRRNLWGRST